MLVKLLLAFSHYSAREISKALDLLQSEDLNSGQLSPYALYIKGIGNLANIWLEHKL